MSEDVPRVEQRLPFVIDGRRIEATATGRSVELPSAETGPVRVPLFDDVVERLSGLDRMVLADTPLQSIVAFLHRVGVMWGNDEYARRRLFVRQLREIVGFSEEMAVAEADLMASVLTAGSRLWDTVAIELGDRHVLDTWVRREDSQVRAVPRGLALHVLAGTVPVASVISIVRSLVTKNLTVARYASADPVTATSLALSFLDCDADHPVARALQVVHWPSSDTAGNDFARHVDVLCVWGGHGAMDWARSHAGESEVVRFGPRRSLAVIDTSQASADGLDRVARRVAHDVAMYDQTACFSCLQVFATEPVGDLIDALRVASEHYRRILPPARRSDDLSAQVQATRLHHEFLGHRVERDAAAAWTIVECQPDEIDDAPAARTLFVHPVDDPSAVLAWVDPSVQTVAVHPWSLSTELGDALAVRGVDRIVEVGLSSVIRLRAAHDGVYPLTRFVRLVSIEDPADRHGKGMVLPVELGPMLERRDLRDLVL